MATLVSLGINLSIVLMVFGIALTAGAGGVRLAFRNPALLLRSLFAMYVVMPLVAVAIALWFELSRPLLIALMLLALAPVPPLLPVKQVKAGGGMDYVLGLLVASALAAIVVVPVGIELIGRVFGRDLEVPFGVPARVVGVSVLAPMLAGLVVAHVAPGVAARISAPLLKSSGILLVALFLPVLVLSWDTIMSQVGDFTIVAILLFIGIGLAAGHLLGGPDDGNRTALALATATRHPGVAIAVVHAVAPAEKDVAAVIFLYLLVGVAASIPYMKWRQRVGAGARS